MGKIINLHILRALATIVVVFAHAVTRTDRWGQFTGPVHTQVEILGSMAVDTFFVISGFIMVYTSVTLFGSSAGVSEFARRRLIRVVPLYWFATAVEVVLRARHSNPPNLSTLVHSLLFLPHVTVPGEALRPLVGVGWTLNYEVLFYVMFGLAVFLPRRIGIATLLAAVVGIVAAGGFLKPLTDTTTPLTVATYLTDRIILMFGVGVVIGLVYGPNGPPTHARLRYPYAIVFALVVGNIALLFVSDASAHLSLPWDIMQRAIVTAVVVVCLFGVPSRLLEPTRTLSVVGDASYSIYLFHFILIVATEKLWLATVGPKGAVFCVLVVATAAHLGGVAIYFTIEKPMTRFLQDLVKSYRVNRGGSIAKTATPSH